MATLPASVVLPRPWPLLRLLPVRLHRLLAPCAPVRTLLLACRRRPLPALAVAPPAPAASWTPLRSPRGSPSHHLTPSVRRLLRRQGWNGPLEMQPWAYPPIPGLASAAARWMDLVLVSSFSFLHHWCFFFCDCGWTLSKGLLRPRSGSLCPLSGPIRCPATRAPEQGWMGVPPLRHRSLVLRWQVLPPSLLSGVPPGMLRIGSSGARMRIISTSTTAGGPKY